MIKHHAQAHLAGPLNPEGLPWSSLTPEPTPLTTLQICLQESPVITMGSGMFSLIISVCKNSFRVYPGRVYFGCTAPKWAGPLAPVRAEPVLDSENSY